MLEFFTSRATTIEDYLSTQMVPTKAWTNIFSWKYWTDGPLSPQTEYSLFSTVVVIALVVILIYWRRKLTKIHKRVPVYEKVNDQIFSLIMFIVIVFFAYAFFRLQSITYLSSRLVLLSALIVTAAWWGIIIYNLKVVIPKKKAAYLEKERFFRYLPKSKS